MRQPRHGQPQGDRADHLDTAGLEVQGRDGGGGTEHAEQRDRRARPPDGADEHRRQRDHPQHQGRRVDGPRMVGQPGELGEEPVGVDLGTGEPAQLEPIMSTATPAR